jgi:hypothetical protein
MLIKHRVQRSSLLAACGALLLVTGCTNAANEPSPETRTAGPTPASSAPPSSSDSCQSTSDQPITEHRAVAR